MHKNLLHIALIMLMIIGSLSIVNCQLSTNTTWDLEKCIQFAASNNLDLKTASLSLIQSEINKKQVKYSYLPSLNGGATHGYNWGQTLDPFSNLFASDRVRSNSMYLSSNVNLFSGMKNYYTSKKSNSDYLVQKYSNEILQRDLKIEVSGLFLQALMNHKAIEIIQNQLNYSLEQAKRIEILVEQKHKTNFDLLEVKSQLALDSLAFYKAKNEYNISTLRLKQFLNLKSEKSFTIDTTFSKNEIVSSDIEYSQLEENLLVEEQINAQEMNLKIAHSGRYPSLSLSASLGTGYSGNNPNPFEIQGQENFYQTATLSLNIPIFNGNQVNSQIQMANIELDKAQIQKDKTLLDIENKVEQLKFEIKNANSQVSSTKKVLNFLSQNFEASTLKYEEGVINYSQLLEVKNKLIKTEMELLQSQFQLAFKVRILDLYSK